MTGAALRTTWLHFFRGRRIVLDTWRKLQNSLARCRQLCTQHSIVEGHLRELNVFDVVNFEIEEVSWNCFVLDVVQFNKRGSLTDLSRFRFRQV